MIDIGTGLFVGELIMIGSIVVGCLIGLWIRKRKP